MNASPGPNPSAMNSSRLMPLAATLGKCAFRRSAPAGTRVCHALQTTENPCRIRKPSPAWAAVVGRLPSAPRLRRVSATLLPRLGTSYSNQPFPLPRSVGVIRVKSERYSTRPAALRGALSRLTIGAFKGCDGSSSPWIVPLTHSYVPTGPKFLPSKSSHPRPSAAGINCCPKRSGPSIERMTAPSVGESHWVGGRCRNSGDVITVGLRRALEACDGHLSYLMDIAICAILLASRRRSAK